MHPILLSVLLGLTAALADGFGGLQEGLGGDNTVRGVVKNRFQGQGIMVANSELRWRLSAERFTSAGLPIVIGGHTTAGSLDTMRGR